MLLLKKIALISLAAAFFAPLEARANGCFDRASAYESPDKAVAPVDKLLHAFPYGGLSLAAAVRDSVIADPTRAEAVYKLIDTANVLQRRSIARGLGEAAAVCAAFQPAAAKKIRDLFARAPDTESGKLFASAVAVSQVLSGPAPTTGRCYADAPPVSAEAVKAFMADPKAILAKFPLGGGEFSIAIRDLVISDAATMKSLGDVIAAATPLQKNAIAAGLGQASNTCEKQANDISLSIRAFIANSNEAMMSRTFAAITGDITVGALGGSGGFGSLPGAAIGGGGALGNSTSVGAGTQGFNSVRAATQFSFGNQIGTTGANRSNRSSVFAPVSP
jgi:hypothetical protein